MNEKDKAINDLAEQFRLDCQNMVEIVLNKLRKPNNHSYDNATYVWLFRKLAELQLEINELKSNQHL